MIKQQWISWSAHDAGLICYRESDDMDRNRFHSAWIVALSAVSVGIPVSSASALETRQTEAAPVIVRQQMRVAQPATREATAPTRAAPIITNPPAGAVILRAEPTDETIKSLNVLSQRPINTFRSKPVVMLSNTRLNFQPMLDNPQALFNTANNLRKLPQSVDVLTDDTTAFEIDEGIIVRSKMTYQLKAGTCSNTMRRAAVASAGLDCATKLDDAALAAAFANKNDARYVADPQKRAAALAEAYTQRAVMSPKIAAHIADLRNAFNDPAKRGQIDAKLGAGEAARLAGLNDDQLTMEIINTAQTEVEEVIFIPKNETPNARLSTSSLDARNGSDTAPPPMQLIFNSGIKAFAKGDSAGSDAPATETVRNLDTRIFLTGFTLGRRYEWSKQVGITINWCLVSCKETYYAKVFATIGLGFGLRFPMQISGLYKHRVENGQETASITANYEPIDGDANDYKNAGLADEQIFGGQEIVAEAIAEAGVVFDLPFYGLKTVSWKEGDNYTAALPAPFTNGQFKPPAPGGTGFPAMEKVFTDIDLLAGFADWKIFGATVHPAIKAELHSDKLSFRFHDIVNGETTLLQSSGQTIPLAINPSDHSSRFTLGNPVYDLGFLVTPGLQGRLFINLAVWEVDFKKTVWFPQVALDLPPGGVEFACHEGTSCSRSYTFSPAHQSEGIGPTSAVDEKLLQWKLGFENKWKPQCPDQECKGGIWIIAAATMNYQKKLLDQTADIEWKVHTLELPKDAKMEHYAKINQGYQDAENQAAESLELANIRKSKKGSTYPITLTYIPLPKAPSEPAPPVIPKQIPSIPILILPPPAASRATPTVMKSTLCRFDSGPRAGQVQDYAPMAPIPVGSNCQDAQGSFGRVVAQ
jgi:hypothetical protein